MLLFDVFGLWFNCFNIRGHMKGKLWIHLYLSLFSSYSFHTFIFVSTASPFIACSCFLPFSWSFVCFALLVWLLFLFVVTGSCLFVFQESFLSFVCVCVSSLILLPFLSVGIVCVVLLEFLVVCFCFWCCCCCCCPCCCCCLSTYLLCLSSCDLCNFCF